MPAAATAYRREEAGYRYHSIPWPTEPDTPPVSIELGIMAGGLLVQAAGAGTTHFRFSQPGPSPHWSEAWQMQVQPQLTLTSEELDTLSENEFKALVDTGQGPDRLRKQLIQRASEQRLRTTRNGLLPQPCNSPIFPKVISSPEMDGLPYGQGPSIFVHGTPVRITGPKDQYDGWIAGALAVSAATALYGPQSQYVPVDTRHIHFEETLATVKDMTDINFTSHNVDGEAPFRTASLIQLNAQVNGQTVQIEAPLVITGESLDDLDVVYNPELVSRQEMEDATARALWEGSSRISKNIALDEDQRIRDTASNMLADRPFRN